jgi:VWFA-related protein
MRDRRFTTAVVLAFALSAGALTAQRPAPGADQQQAQQPSRIPGTFRSAVTLVPLDVRVLDERGRPVTDLERDDFVVFEDDVPQRIGHFSHQILTAVAPAPDAVIKMREAPGDVLKPQNHRVFLLVLGRGRLQYPAKGVDAAIDFVREQLLPQDQVAVLAYNRATDFSTNRDEVIQVLERFREHHELIEADLKHRISGLAAVYGSREIPANMQARIDEIFDGPESPGFRRLPPGRIVDLESIAEDRREVYDLTGPFGGGFETWVAMNVQTLHDLGNVYGGIEYLRYIEGEKHLVFLTENGLFVPRVENDRNLADVASDARVVIDIIKTGGLYSEPPARWLSNTEWLHTFSAMTLRNVGRMSGGQTSLYRYASQAFNRIDEATRSSYLIGYYPSDTDWTGEFRRVKVKVNRRGVTVLVRGGYFAREQLVPFDRRQFMTYNRVVSAGGYGEEISDIGLRLKASAAANRDGGRDVLVDLRIDPSRVRFAEADGIHTATLDVTVYCGDKRQDTLCERWDKAELKFDAEGLERAKKEGVPYLASVPLKDPKAQLRHVKVVVYDYAADVLGTASVRIK